MQVHTCTIHATHMYTEHMRHIHMNNVQMHVYSVREHPRTSTQNTHDIQGTRTCTHSQYNTHIAHVCLHSPLLPASSSLQFHQRGPAPHGLPAPHRLRHIGEQWFPAGSTGKHTTTGLVTDLPKPATNRLSCVPCAHSVGGAGMGFL